MPLRNREQAAIEKLADWRVQLDVDELFVRSRSAGASGYGLAKRQDGRCVFLDNENLCAIHKKFGSNAKPMACQLYPFVLTPIAGRLHIGLRFDCPAVCQSHGDSLLKYRSELEKIAQKLIPKSTLLEQIPKISHNKRASAEQLELVNQAILKIVTSNAVDLAVRLHWIERLLCHLDRIKWQNITDDELGELLGMFGTTVLMELNRETRRRRPLQKRARKLLGQFFFLLSQPTTILSGKKDGWLDRLQQRSRLAKQMGRLGRSKGQLPPVQPYWPKCDLSELEAGLGPWPTDVQQMLGRYLICRIAGMGYYGPNMYNMSLIDGTRTILLGFVTIGWLMRIEAVKAGRDHIELSDAHQAVMTIDGNLGYSSTLDFGPARLRLRYLSGHIGDFIDWYCL